VRSNVVLHDNFQLNYTFFKEAGGTSKRQQTIVGWEAAIVRSEPSGSFVPKIYSNQVIQTQKDVKGSTSIVNINGNYGEPGRRRPSKMNIPSPRVEKHPLPARTPFKSIDRDQKKNVPEVNGKAHCKPKISPAPDNKNDLKVCPFFASVQLTLTH